MFEKDKIYWVFMDGGFYVKYNKLVCYAFPTSFYSEKAKKNPKEIAKEMINSHIQLYGREYDSTKEDIEEFNKVYKSAIDPKRGMV